jgi:aminotransferase EvaB
MTKQLINFLPDQYKETNQFPINHNYLLEQFSDKDIILEKISKVVTDGDFTLGSAVNAFEQQFANIIGVRHAIGVGSGTDAIFLSLKALGIKPGDEVITSPFTFYATVGAIVTAGARPVFVDISDDLNINSEKIEAAITNRTKAIVPIHWAGQPCNMVKLMSVAHKNKLYVVEDACHAIGASSQEGNMGAIGTTGCFSLHPLKNLNVWGDGGIICTNSGSLANQLLLLRNHGLADRETCEVFGYNSRLDTIQAVVASHMLGKLENINSKRLHNANYLDRALRAIPQVKMVNQNRNYISHSYHLYSQLFEERDKLKEYLNSIGVDAKIHYPVPMHLQPAAKYLGYKKGDFPITESVTASILSLPIHEFISRKQLDIMITGILRFYNL